MNEFKFGAVSMVSDSTLTSLPVGGIANRVMSMLQLLFNALECLDEPTLVLPTYYFSMFYLWKKTTILFLERRTFCN